MGITEHPHGPGAKGQGCYSGILTETRRKRTMLCGIVKRYCLLIVRSAFHYVSRVQQRAGHEAMTNNKGYCGCLFFSECQELA